MKKENLILLLLLAVIALQVVILLRPWKEESSTSGTSTGTSTEKSSAGTAFRSILTEPMADYEAKKAQRRFDSLLNHREHMAFPKAIYVNNTFIEAIRRSTDINGMVLIFGAYPASTTNSGGMRLNENEITLIMAPTKDRKMDNSTIYDYSDPCRPPCTEFTIQ